ncbi:MAG: DUF134 domain-containing protein, partial [Spirochaetaceae bacterium]
SVHMHRILRIRSGEVSVPRCVKRRRCRELGERRVFKPAGIPAAALEAEYIGLDELEAMRLCDVEGYDQSTAGAHMGVSRGTVQRLLARGRARMVGAVVANRALVFERSACTSRDSMEPAASVETRNEKAEAPQSTELSGRKQ